MAIVFVTKVATRVSGEVIRACPAPYGVSVISRFDDAPPALARALTDRVGEIAPVGAEFNPTDVHIIGETGKSRRLIFIWSLGNRWVVATERGGVGYNNPIFAFDAASDGLSAAFVEERVYISRILMRDRVKPACRRKLVIPGGAPPKDAAR
jgi:hypothetical protein